jgi:hypothetical protein
MSWERQRFGDFKRPYPEVLKSPAGSSCLKSDSEKANLLEPMVQKLTWGLPFRGALGKSQLLRWWCLPKNG